jgi:branched-subunit amino acid aminotransferase/4-amino-4-deoxychorismate lyase
LNANILPSITRKHVLEAAKNIGLPVEEESIMTVEAKISAELFLAVTTRDIIPVVKFDGQKIGTGGPGKLTKQLIETFKKFTGA